MKTALIKSLFFALGTLLTTSVACFQSNALPLPMGSNGPYTPFAKPPRFGQPAPHYSISLIRGAKPKPTTRTMIMHAAGRGAFPALIQRPLVRRWYSYFPTPPGLKNYHIPHLPSLPGYQEVQPLAVNRHHQIVGFYRGGGAGAYLVILARPFSYQHGRLHLLPTLLDYTITHPVDTSDKGEIVGDAALGSFPGDENVPAHAVCWVHGKVHDLGTGAASSINTAGNIVGDSGNGPAVYYHDAHALLWTRGCRYDLNECIPPRCGWVLSTATRINDKGQITGYGLFHGKGCAFLLTPR